VSSTKAFIKATNITHKIQKPQNPLSKTTQSYLTNGNTLPEGNRNNQLFRAACDIHGNNFNYQDAFNMLAPIAQISGLHNQEIAHTIQSAYNQKRTPSRQQGREIIPTQQIWQKALQFSETHAWQGRTGNTNRAVFHALTERAKLGTNQGNAFRASVREIAVLARVSRETAHISGGVSPKYNCPQLGHRHTKQPANIDSRFFSSESPLSAFF